MIEFKNKKYIGGNERISVYDIQIPKAPKAMIIFAHGYKGFKDWGAWNEVQNYFVKAGYGFLKFNFSHNGGTVDNPIDFPDLTAFGNNNYSFELFDLNKITSITYKYLFELKLEVPVYLIGHSRGGGMSIIHAAHDQRIHKIVSWAGISDIEKRFPMGAELEDWKIAGERMEENARTKQQMPHYYQMYEDYLMNKSKLDIKVACEILKQPFLQIHGDMDLAVSISEGIMISRWTDSELCIIKGAGHTFQTKHPWEEAELPPDLLRVLEATLTFFEKEK